MVRHKQLKTCIKKINSLKVSEGVRSGFLDNAVPEMSRGVIKNSGASIKL